MTTPTGFVRENACRSCGAADRTPGAETCAACAATLTRLNANLCPRCGHAKSAARPICALCAIPEGDRRG